jgi:transposase
METDLEVYCINPLILRRFAEQRLHAGKTDRISAQLMADYLRSGGVEANSEGTEKALDQACAPSLERPRN